MGTCEGYRRYAQRPHRARVGAAAAALVSALVFAAGHLPALMQISEPTAPLIARTLTLNAAAGLFYGFCFWRWGLESAMLAHASTHVGFAALRIVSA